MWWPWIASAAAHTVEGQLFGHYLGVWIGERGLEVEYAIEIPTRAVVREAEAAGAEWDRRLRDEIVSGLVVEVDGASLRTKLASFHQPDGDSGFFTCTARFDAELPHGDAHVVRVTNGNRPEEPSVFRTDVQVDETWRATDSTLLLVVDGAVERTVQGKWVADEASRTLSVAIERRSRADAVARALSLDRDGWDDLRTSYTWSAVRAVATGWIPIVLAALAVPVLVVLAVRRRPA